VWCPSASCSLPFLHLFSSGYLTLELRLAERRSVASNDDKLGLSGAKGLEGRLVTKSDLAGLWKMVRIGPSLSGHFHSMRTLIVKASLALMLSDVLVLFFGAILNDVGLRLPFSDCDEKSSRAESMVEFGVVDFQTLSPDRKVIGC
jgi:hypothetical protein